MLKTSPLRFFGAVFFPVLASLWAKSTIAKSMSGVLLRRSQGGIPQLVADGHDDVALLIDHRLHVLGVVRVDLGLHLSLLDAVALTALVRPL